MRLPTELKDRKGVVLDTMVFIYLFEDGEPFAAVAEFLVQQMEVGAFHGILTPITAAEILVKPYSRQRVDIAKSYQNALRSITNLDSIEISHEIGYRAASLKAAYGLPLPDMIQLACALESNTPALVTNDKALKKVNEVRIFLFDEFV